MPPQDDTTLEAVLQGKTWNAALTREQIKGCRARVEQADVVQLVNDAVETLSGRMHLARIIREERQGTHHHVAYEPHPSQCRGHLIVVAGGGVVGGWGSVSVCNPCRTQTLRVGRRVRPRSTSESVMTTGAILARRYAPREDYAKSATCSTLVKEARAALAEAMKECRADPASRAACEAEARAQYRRDLEDARRVTQGPQ